MSTDKRLTIHLQKLAKWALTHFLYTQEFAHTKIYIHSIIENLHRLHYF